jgi:site-specific DNA-methyltransferase (adenine-specific)
MRLSQTPRISGTTACKWDNVIPFDDMWKRLNALIKPNGAIVLFGSEPFSSLLRVSNLKAYKYDWKWDKTTATGHLNAKKQPMRANEDICIFYYKQPVFNPQKTQGHSRKISSAASRAKSIERAINKTKVYGNENINTIPSYDSTERYPRNIIKFSNDKQKSAIHPTQKPVALMEYLIKTYTNEGETVLDFTMGSGTTGVACKQTNRNFYGCELEPDYVAIANKRLEKVQGNLFGAEA